jgi:Na+/glutamate symporter
MKLSSMFFLTFALMTFLIVMAYPLIYPDFLEQQAEFCRENAWVDGCGSMLPLFLIVLFAAIIVSLFIGLFGLPPGNDPWDWQ